MYDAGAYKLDVHLHEHGLPSVLAQLFHDAWAELEECYSTQSYEEFMRVQQELLSGAPYFEISIALNGQIIGGMQFIVGYDLKVGLCTLPVHTYISPAHRSLKLTRALLRFYFHLAREYGCPVAAVSHREAPWRYVTVFKRL